MARLPDVLELEGLNKEAFRILSEQYSPELNKIADEDFQSAMTAFKTGKQTFTGPRESIVDKSQRDLMEAQDKQRRVFELVGPFQEAQLYIQSAPRKRGFFSRDPFKKHKEQIKQFESLLDAAARMIQTRQQSLEEMIERNQTLREPQAQDNAFLKSTMSYLEAAQREQNAQAKATRNAANTLRRMEKEEVEKAQARMNQRRREIDMDYNNAMKMLMGRKGGKRTRRSRGSSKATRKH